MVVLVRDINVEDHFRVRRLLKAPDRILRRRILRQRKKLRGHDAAGRILGILQNVGDFCRVLGPHQRENFLGTLFGQHTEDVGDVVGSRGL